MRSAREIYVLHIFAHLARVSPRQPLCTQNTIHVSIIVAYIRSILCHLHPQTLSSMAKCYKLAVKGFDIDDLRIEDRRDSKIENMAPSDDKVSWQHDMPPASIACNSPSTRNVRELPQCTSMLCCSNHDNREGYHAVGKTYRCWVEVQLTSGNTFEMHVGCCKMFV